MKGIYILIVGNEGSGKLIELQEIFEKYYKENKKEVLQKIGKMEKEKNDNENKKQKKKNNKNESDDIESEDEIKMEEKK